MQDLTIRELLTLLKASNDGGEVIRTHGATAIRSRTGVTIHEDGHGWFAGLKFDTVEQLVALMKRRGDPDHGTNDLPQLCDCGVPRSACCAGH